MNKLKNIYYDPETGFVSADKLLRKAKEAGISTTLKDVQDFINKQFTAQVHRQQKRPKAYQSVVAPEYGNNYQMDLLIYDRFTYNKYKYMLVVIDVYSRFVAVRPLTTRKFPVIMRNLDAICDDMGYPKNINCRACARDAVAAA